MGETLIDDVSQRGRPCLCALDGFNGTDFAPALESLQQIVQAAGVHILTINMSDIYKSPPELNALFTPYIDRDPAFGFVYPGELEDLTDDGKALRVTRFC